VTQVLFQRPTGQNKLPRKERKSVAKSDHMGAFATAVAAALAAVDDITSRLLVPIVNVSVGGVSVPSFPCLLAIVLIEARNASRAVDY
jgi:hypothetical protein